MSAPSFHSVGQCKRLSRSQFLQRSDSTSRMVCKRSLVGIIICTTMYHVDTVSSDTNAVCMFFHTCFPFVSRLRCITPIVLDSLAAFAIICRVLYVHRLNVLSISSFPGVTMYAMSSAYRYKYSSYLGILLTWVFALRPDRFHSWGHVAVAEPFRALCIHILPNRRPRHFTSMSIKPQPLASSVSLRLKLLSGRSPLFIITAL
jgi:hypothetical protein